MIISVLMSQVFQAETIHETTLRSFLEKYPNASTLQCTYDYSFDMPPYPLYPEITCWKYPSKGVFENIFILNIPNATAYFDNTGYVFLNNHSILETHIKKINFFYGHKTQEAPSPEATLQLSGRAAIITHLFPHCYGHWILDVLHQLALLEIHNIEYDYLVTPYDSKFMKESLQIWGIDPKKIIPLQRNTLIQADTIIMPTTVTSTIPFVHNTNYAVNFLLDYVRNKIIDNIPNLKGTKTSPSKIFISRKDGGLLFKETVRCLPNEDDVFALFEPLGFKRYELTSLSFAQQVALFYHATEIVACLGSGSTNIIFSQPGTKYIEITQPLVDATFFYLSGMCGLQYYAINASTVNDLWHGHPCAAARSISLDLIEKFLSEHPEISGNNHYN